MEGNLKSTKKTNILKIMFYQVTKQIRQERSGFCTATFRSHLNSLGYNGFISYPSFNHAALEACSQDRIEKLSDTIDSLNFEEKRLFATSVLSESENLQFDTEGESQFLKLLKPQK